MCRVRPQTPLVQWIYSTIVQVLYCTSRLIKERIAWVSRAAVRGVRELLRERCARGGRERQGTRTLQHEENGGGALGGQTLPARRQRAQVFCKQSARKALHAIF